MFLLNAAVGSQAEVEFSRKVVEKSQNEEVNRLAQRIISDHEQLNQQLEQTAQQLGLTIPQGLPHMKKTELRIWESLSGKEQDQQYVTHLLIAHAAAVEACRIEAENAKSPQVKQFASNALPKLQEHHRAVQQLATEIGLNGAQAVPAGAHIPGDRDSNNNTNSGRGAK